MARYRTIKPEFWDDVKLAKLSRDVRLLYIGTWNFSDDLGVIQADPLYIKSKVFPYDQIQIQQFKSWLTDLERNGFINLFTYNNVEFYYLPKFSRHQVINRPNFNAVCISKSVLDNLLEQFTDESLNNHGNITDESLLEKNKKENKSKSREFTPPSVDEVVSYFYEKGYTKESAQRAHEYYSTSDWHDNNNKKVKNWKQKMLSVWFKPENKVAPGKIKTDYI